jgi:hypothetical protein
MVSARQRPFEYLRLTSLGVIGALVKVDDPEVIRFLLFTDILPHCVRIMGDGSELSKTVATFIVQKILLDQTGLATVCSLPERLSLVCNVLQSMVVAMREQPAVRLLKHIIRCYQRLAENPVAKEALHRSFPDCLREQAFFEALRDDPNTRKCMQALISAIAEAPPRTGSAPGPVAAVHGATAAPAPAPTVGPAPMMGPGMPMAMTPPLPQTAASHHHHHHHPHPHQAAHHHMAKPDDGYAMRSLLLQQAAAAQQQFHSYQPPQQPM